MNFYSAQIANRTPPNSNMELENQFSNQGQMDVNNVPDVNSHSQSNRCTQCQCEACTRERNKLNNVEKKNMEKTQDGGNGRTDEIHRRTQLWFQWATSCRHHYGWF